jgi:hypothetical protein
MNLPNLQIDLEDSIRAIEKEDAKIIALQNCLLFAFERTKTEPFDCTGLICDVLKEFEYLSIENIIEALRNGGLGKYGRTFKLSTQEICYWIRQHNKKPIKLDRL